MPLSFHASHTSQQGVSSLFSVFSFTGGGSASAVTAARRFAGWCAKQGGCSLGGRDMMKSSGAEVGRCVCGAEWRCVGAVAAVWQAGQGGQLRSAHAQRPGGCSRDVDKKNVERGMPRRLRRRMPAAYAACQMPRTFTPRLPNQEPPSAQSPVSAPPTGGRMRLFSAPPRPRAQNLCPPSSSSACAMIWLPHHVLLPPSKGVLFVARCHACCYLSFHFATPCLFRRQR